MLLSVFHFLEGDTNTMKKKTVRALKIAPLKVPVAVTVSNDLDSWQKAVSEGSENQGLIEVINLSETACMICNEEAKLIGLAPNRRFCDDIICGTFYVVGQDGHGNFTSLSEADFEFYSLVFAVPHIISDDEVEDTVFTIFDIL